MVYPMISGVSTILLVAQDFATITVCQTSPDRPATKAYQGTFPGSEGVIHHAVDSVKNFLIGHQLLQKLKWFSSWLRWCKNWMGLMCAPSFLQNFLVRKQDHTKVQHSSSFPKLAVSAAQVQQTIGCSRAFRTEVLSALSTVIISKLSGWPWGRSHWNQNRDTKRWQHMEVSNPWG